MLAFRDSDRPYDPFQAMRDIVSSFERNIPHDISVKAGHLHQKIDDKSIDKIQVSGKQLIALLKMAEAYAELTIKMGSIKNDLKKVLDKTDPCCILKM